MPVLWAALAIVGAICLLNLLLTIAVIRRLREHTELINRGNAQASGQGEITLPAGARVGDFRVVTGDNREVTRDDLREGLLVAFFSPRCPSCEEQKPAFVRYASGLSGGRDDVIAVLLGSPEELEGLREELSGVAQIVIEADVEGDMSTAFGLSGYPAFCLMGQDGVLAVTGYRVDILPGYVAL
ncbi:TlpA family protein disulfide reductase [Nonomuraea jiangxiensis]|uniref:AhpC/TSA family protein n=1 Tax=Nonomuraea jiangxiensis TaxID=633440 RepID=A0A1G8FAL7_9ACTN|nr:redoxin domain-containing protein [Nonomuraea jiangxiensis]SDH79135.1 AhpC/TSA family protein [Nonomuraea jiangxiensis]